MEYMYGPPLSLHENVWKHSLCSIIKRTQKISWMHYITNNNILEQIGKKNEILSTVKIQKLSLFGNIGRNMRI